MSISNRVQWYSQIITEQGYRPRQEGTDTIAFRYQGATYKLVLDDQDDALVRVIWPETRSIRADQQDQADRAIIAVNSRLKVGKLSRSGDTISSAVNLFVESPDHFKPIFERTMGILQDSARSFDREMRSPSDDDSEGGSGRADLADLLRGLTGSGLPGLDDIARLLQAADASGGGSGDSTTDLLDSLMSGINREVSGRSAPIAATRDGRAVAVFNQSESRVRIKWRDDQYTPRVMANDGITTLLFTNDANVCIGAGTNGVISVWNAQNGDEVRTLRGHSDAVSNIALSPDNTLLASSSADGVVRIWRMADGHCLHICTSDNSRHVRALCIPNNNWVISGGDDGKIRCWDMHAGVQKWNQTAHSDWIRQITTCGSGTVIASSSDDKSVKLWNISDGTLVRELSGHSAWVRVIAASPTGSMLASGDDQGIVIIWRVSDGSTLYRLSGHAGNMYSLSWSSDGMSLVTTSQQGHARCWNMSDGTERWHLNTSISKTHAAITYASTAAVYADNQLYLVNIPDGSIIAATSV